MSDKPSTAEDKPSSDKNMPAIVKKDAPVITIPPNTPIKLKKIANMMMPGFDTELN